MADALPTDTSAKGPILRISSGFTAWLGGPGLATISDTASFRPLWQPPFISAIVAEDRCHLNGLAMDGPRAAYVTAISRSDVADGRRERRQDGGVILDVASGETVATGLSMPHSPRLYDGRLWVLNSGRGELCTVDPAGGAVTPVAAVSPSEPNPDAGHEGLAQVPHPAPCQITT